MSNQASKGALYNYLNLLLINVIGLLLTPYIIRSLGPSQYGIYVLMTTLIPYFALLDMGMGKTITRYVAHYRAEKRSDSEAQFLTTASRIYLFITLLLLIAGGTLYALADDIWSNRFTASEMAEIRRIILVIIATQAIIIPGNAFTAICNGCGLFAFPRGIQLVKYITRAICVVGLLLCGQKALALIAVDALLNIIVIVATLLYVKHHIGRKQLFARSGSNARPIVQYSAWIALYAATCTFQWNIGPIIAGLSLNTTMVGIMGVGIVLGNMYGYFAETINRMTLPRATRFIATQPSSQAVTQEMCHIGRLVAIPQLCILGGFLLFGREFIAFWAGELYHEAYYITLIMMGAWLIQLTQDYGNSLLEAKGRVRTLSIINFISIFAGVIVSYCMAPRWGIQGIAYSLAGGTAVATIANNVYYHYRLGLQTGSYFIGVFGRLAFVTAGLVGVFTIIKNKCFDVVTWQWLIIGAACFVICYLILTYAIILTREERELIKTHAHRE